MPLGPDGRLAGRGELAQELGGQGGGGGLGQGAAVERDLAAGVAHRRPEVVAVQLQQLVPVSPRSQRKNGMSGCSQVLGQAPGRRQVDLLEHVGGVDAALEPPVEPEGHHPPQPGLMPGEQAPQLPWSPAAMRRRSRFVSVESRVMVGSMGDELRPEAVTRQAEPRSMILCSGGLDRPGRGRRILATGTRGARA